MVKVTGSVDAVVAAAAAAVDPAGAWAAGVELLLDESLPPPPQAARRTARAATMPRPSRRRAMPSIRSLHPVWERSQKGNEAEFTPSSSRCQVARPKSRRGALDQGGRQHGVCVGDDVAGQAI